MAKALEGMNRINQTIKDFKVNNYGIPREKGSSVLNPPVCALLN